MKQNATKSLSYPSTHREDLLETLHEKQVADPYRWMEEPDNPELREWIEAQNQITFAYLDEIPEREQIQTRMTELWNYERYGVPYKRGGRYFFTRNDGLQNQSVLYWMESLDDEPRLLLDPNTLSDDGTVALMDFSVSKDGRFLAYGLSAAGSDWMEWRVRAVDSGEDLSDHLQWVKFSSATWTHDGLGLFYSRYDEPQGANTYKDANYNQKLCFHQIGSAQTEDEVVYARPDHKEWGFGSTISEDGQYLIIHVWQGTHRENNLFYQDLQTGGPVVELLTGFEAEYTFIGNDGPHFYVYTDLDAPNARVVVIDIRQPSRDKWREVIPEATDALEQAYLIGDKLIAHYLHDAHSQIKIYATDGAFVRALALPDMGTVTSFAGTYGDPEAFFAFSSFTTPELIYRYDVETGDLSVFRQPQLPFDPEDYVTEQIFYTSKDGTRIPMFIVRRRDVTPSPHTPTYQYGYGGFNISLTPEFRASWLVWLEMGGMIAQPNLRGGGEYGKVWHDNGKILRKQNVFDDFIAASEWLIANGYTSTPKLAIGGRSNGGLLVGACMTQRPDLFGACVPGVGVLDMIRFHKFTIGWAWTSDYGSPDNKDELAALLAYSPYHNIKPGTAYPATLITTGDHDDRVYPAHSFKFAAALQHAQEGDEPVLIRIETRAGHGAGKPTAKVIEEASDIWAFLWRELQG